MVSVWQVKKSICSWWPGVPFCLWGALLFPQGRAEDGEKLQLHYGPTAEQSADGLRGEERERSRGREREGTGRGGVRATRRRRQRQREKDRRKGPSD